MILLITYEEEGITRVSHGIDMDTLKTVILPNEPVYYFDKEIKAGEMTTNEYREFRSIW